MTLSPWNNNQQKHGFASASLSAPSPGDDLQSKSAIRVRGQNCTPRYYCEATYIEWPHGKLVQILGGDLFVPTVRLRLRCVLRWKIAKSWDPPTPDRAPNPHFLEKRVHKSHFSSPSHRLEKGQCSVQKIPISTVFSLAEKGIFGPKASFPRTKLKGFFWGARIPGEAQAKSAFHCEISLHVHLRFKNH